MKFPLKLSIIIDGKRQGQVTIKSRSDYRTMRASGFSRPDGSLNTTFQSKNGELNHE